MIPCSKDSDVVIAGLGNLLLRDDGVGVHAVRELLKDPPRGVTVAEIGTAILRAQELLERANVVIAIDAVKADGLPGSIYRFNSYDAQVPKSFSIHNLGIIAMLRLLPKDSRPAVIILGVEPQLIDYGMELSPPVQAALPRLIDAARSISRQIVEGTRHGYGVVA
ncbi:MAG: hydrogenase maturation protease [Planctomycetota bacterium]|jgi:hydrogenase maturation protease